MVLMKHVVAQNMKLYYYQKLWMVNLTVLPVYFPKPFILELPWRKCSNLGNDIDLKLEQHYLLVYVSSE